jgi:hypothetical protein
MSGNEHFHRGYSLRPHKSKSLINHGIISNPRLGRRLAAMLSIFAGSAVGAVLVSLGGLALPLAVTGACILLVTVAYAVHPASKVVSSDAHH